MSNAQDLLSILGGGARPPTRGAGASSTSGVTETSILSFKAGKMNTTLRPNGKYLVEPDSRRGELHVIWTAAPPSAAGGAAAVAGAAAPGGSLRMEWRDRRTNTAVNSVPVFPEDDATFERVETGRDCDRVYLLTCGGGRDAESKHFFWMQDKDAEPDEDLCVKVNLYMSDYSEAAAAATETAGGTNASSEAASESNATNGGMDNAELLRIMQGALGGTEGARTVTVPGSRSIPTADAGQVDALGNILESMGVPRPGGTPAGEINRAAHAAPAAASTGGAGGGGLTLADLQGAMAGLATASPPQQDAAAPGPPLSELASPDIVEESGILDDPEAVARLIALLPEGQRDEPGLRENLHSPQVAQCLHRLSAALVEDAGSFNSIIANFQLDPNDGAGALAAGNPIEAFLNCLLRDVERREGIRNVGNDGEEKGDEGCSNESKKEEDGGGEGDVKMDES